MNYPGSFLHQLSGDKKGYHAVKVSGKWRIFFKFIDGDAYAALLWVKENINSLGGDLSKIADFNIPGHKPVKIRHRFT